MRLRSLLYAGFAAGLLAAPVALAQPVAYGFYSGSDVFGSIDLATGASTDIAFNAIPQRTYACDFVPEYPGELLCIIQDANEVLTLDLVTGAVTKRGDYALEISVPLTITYDRTTDTLFGIDRDGLITIDRDTWSPAPVGAPLPFRALTLAASPSGRLYSYAVSEDAALYEFDKATGAVTLVGSGGGTPETEFAFASASLGIMPDGTCYVFTTNSQLQTCDLETGALTQVAALGVSGVDVMAVYDVPTVCEGDFDIQSRSAFDTFVGLGCAEVTGDLYISVATIEGLASLAGLETLQRVGGRLSLSGSPIDPGTLTSLSGLDNLASVGALELLYVPGLTSLDGLGGLETITAEDPERTVYIVNNGSLTDLSALSGAELLTEDSEVVIFGNSTLRSLDGLEGLTRTGTLSVLDNGITDFSAIGAFETIADVLRLSEPTLTSLNVLSGLSELGGVRLNGAPGLTNLDPLLPFAGTLSVFEFGRTGVSDISAFSGLLPDTLESINIYLNEDLTDLTGLEGVTFVEGNVYIDGVGLTDLSGLSDLTATGGNFEIYETLSITDLSAFPNLETVGGRFGFYLNEGLTSLSGVTSLMSVGGLYVDLNPALENLDALAGIAPIRAVSGSIWDYYIAENASLADCSCGLYAALTDPASGEPTIFGNAPGCSSAEEIIAGYDAGSCAVGGPALSGSLAYGTCPASLPAGRFACRVDAAGTLGADAGQRFTVFLRVAETGRVAFRGEIKPEAGATVEQSVQFRTVGADPASFTLELVAEAGSVAAPSDGAEVIGTLDFTKGGAGLRADAPLAAYPNPAAGSATLAFAVAEPTEARVVVYDALGREVARPVDGEVEGQVTAALDASALAPGLYVVRLTTDSGRAETERLSVAR